jgi:hypothetical protein
MIMKFHHSLSLSFFSLVEEVFSHNTGDVWLVPATLVYLGMVRVVRDVSHLQSFRFDLTAAELVDSRKKIQSEDVSTRCPQTN